MSGKGIDLPLSTLANGAIQEKLDCELKKVFDNIHDLNTKAQAKRTITIKLDFIPNDTRQTVAVESNFSSKLADVEGVSTVVLTGRDIMSGRIEARELKSSIPGQTYLEDDGSHRTDVGEPIDVVEQEMSRKNIINLQRERG